MIQRMFANFHAVALFGKILAILMIVDTLAGAFGTCAISILRDSAGSNLAGIDLMTGLLLLAFVCVLILKPARSGSTLADMPTGD